MSMKQYSVWWPERGHEREDGQLVMAYSAEDAAAVWADRYDYTSNDYSIVGGEVAEVQVAEGEDGPAVTVNVFGEMTRSYRAQAAAKPTEPTLPTQGEQSHD